MSAGIKSIRRFLAGVLLLAGALIFSAPVALARDFPLPPRGAAIVVPPTAPMSGNWIGEAKSVDRTYKILLMYSSGVPLYDGSQYNRLTCVILEPAGLEKTGCRAFGFNGTATSIKATMMGEYGTRQRGLFSASSAFGELTLSLGGGTLTGKWHESDVSFRRLVPRLGNAEAPPVALEELEYLWRHFRENGGAWKNWMVSPPLWVAFSGENLPPAGFGVGEIVVDDPHFEVFRAGVLEDGRLRLGFRLHEGVRPGIKRVTLAGGATGEFELVIARKPCTGIAVTADRPRLGYGESAGFEWRLTPDNCAPPPSNQLMVTLDSSDRKVVEPFHADISAMRRLPMVPNAADLAGRRSFRAIGPGKAELIVTYETLRGAVAIVVDDRPPCTSAAISAGLTVIPVGGQTTLKLPALLGRVESRLSGDEPLLLPDGCAVAEVTQVRISVDPADVLAVTESGRWEHDARGRKPGKATVTVEVGNLKASRDIHVTPIPACDRLSVYFPQPIAVGEVTGVAYRRGPNLHYSYGTSSPGNHNQDVCEKPPGAPYYQASSRHVEIDRDTGAVIGKSVGQALVAVFHGDLMAVGTINVTAAPGNPCTSIRDDPGPLHLKLGARTMLDLPYRPYDCNPPPGRPIFTLDPIGPVAVTPDGTVAGQGPGAATVSVRHGELTTTRRVIVADLPPCTSIDGAFEPGTITALSPVTLKIVYGPLPCVPPAGESTVRLDSRHLTADSVTGTTRGLALSDDLKRLSLGAGSGGIPIVTGDTSTLAVRLEHGALRTNLLLPVVIDLGCRFGLISLDKNRIAVGETARVDVQANRPECIPNAYLVRELNGFTEVRQVDRHFIVRGLRGGSPWIMGPMNSVNLVIEAPPCTSMTLTYPKVMKRRTRAMAEVAYLPAGCTRPQSGTTFVSDSPQTFLVEDTHPGGTIRARDLDRKNPGVATITVTHGPLKASTVVAIETD